MPNNITDLERQLVEAEEELATLKKVYNDLAESHAKQVILNNNQSETIGNLYDQIELLNNEKKELKIQASKFAYESDRAKRDRDSAEEELLKAKERIAELEDENKTLSQFDER